MNIVRIFRPRRSLAFALVPVGVAASMFAAACGGGSGFSSGSGYNAPKNTPMPIATQAQNGTAALAVGTAQSKLGDVLTGPNGMTLYVFAKDTPNKSNCTTGDCLSNWPPLVAQAGQPIQSGTKAKGLFDRISTPSGMQVTHNGAPLYFFAGDAAPGDTRGEGVGGVWSVAKAA